MAVSDPAGGGPFSSPSANPSLLVVTVLDPPPALTAALRFASS